MAVERMRRCDDVGELARELGVARRTLYKWRTKLEIVESGGASARPGTHASSQRKQIHELQRLLGEKAMEVDFLKGALQKVEARRQDRDDSGETASSTRSER
jgi:transposase